MPDITAAPSDLPQLEQRRPAASWVAASCEQALEPSLAIVDAHHHFSEHWGGYMPADLLADAAGHNLRATVYMQCGWHYREHGPEALRPVGETEAVVAATRAEAASVSRARVAAGIVGFADLRLGAAVDEVLEAQVAAGAGRFRGVRFSAARDPHFRHGVLARPAPHLYADAAFRKGYARLAHHGLSFDAWVYHPQLPDVLDLAESFPQVPLMLDHLGGLLGVGPYRERRDAVREQWLPWMKRLARCPNVFLKLGGLGTAVFGFDFAARPVPPSSVELADAWRPVIEPALDEFGAARCLFESNYPVDRSAAGYGVLWNAFKRLVSGASEEDKRMLFHDNAANFYRLESEPGRSPSA